MLKIKDNVDLKVLENYGFKYIKHTFLSSDIDDSYYSNETGIVTINVNIATRSVYIIGNGYYSCDPDCFDALYKLTKDDLVEEEIVEEFDE